ncbi:iron-sulfur cluster assembly protein [Rhodococcus sp. NPDC057014]|uniref:iron-sulfur cluster assembly protein n=1 Tax=Rhodococcus sp. NPDC057014 TaxID=3346000 RepID=UPI003644479A
MTTLAEATDIVVREHQLRITEPDASKALERVTGQSAAQARAKLRFGPGIVCEQLARMLDKALIRAQERGLDAGTLVLSGGSAVAAEDIVRVRRKAHGVADFINSPTSDVTIVLRPKGLVAAASVAPPAAPPSVPQGRQNAPETAAELAVREALYDVIDPDLGVNIVDLGFVRRVEIADDGLATITMTLTSAACPLTVVMESQIRTVLSEMDTEYVVQWEWLPSWRPHDISEDGRDQLRAIGFTAF